MSPQCVVLTGGEGDLAKTIAAEFRAGGDQVWHPGREELDVRDRQSVEAFFQNRDFDLLVCCAGITEDNLLARMPEESWDTVWDTNFRGARWCAQAALQGMVRRRSGHVVFLSSHSALHPPAGQSCYAAAKAALLGLTFDLARQVGGHGVRVNTVLPGFLENRMTREVSPLRKNAVRDTHTLGTFNTMDRVGAFIRFLHAELPHTSGQWFQLDSRPGIF